MYIDKNGLNLTRSVSDNADGTQDMGTAENSVTSDPGSWPISPDTPSWGPPSSSGGSVNDPGFWPNSPNTPSWGPPSSSGGGSIPGLLSSGSVSVSSVDNAGAWRKVFSSHFICGKNDHVYL